MAAVGVQLKLCCESESFRFAPRAAISLRLIAIFGALLNSEFVAPKSTAPDALLRSGDNDFSMLLIGGRGNGCRNQSLFSLRNLATGTQIAGAAAATAWGRILRAGKAESF